MGIRIKRSINGLKKLKESRMPIFTPPVWYHFRTYQAQLILFLVLGVVVAVLLYPFKQWNALSVTIFGCLNVT